MIPATGELFVANQHPDTGLGYIGQHQCCGCNRTQGIRRRRGVAYGVAYDSGKGEIFVTHAAVNAVTVISDSTNAVVANVTVGLTPEELAYDSHTGDIFVTNVVDGTVSVISDSTNAVVATVTVGNGPFGVAYDPGKGEIFVTNAADSTVSVISDASGTSASPTPRHLRLLPQPQLYRSSAVQRSFQWRQQW